MLATDQLRGEYHGFLRLDCRVLRVPPFLSSSLPLDLSIFIEITVLDGLEPLACTCPDFPSARGRARALEWVAIRYSSVTLPWWLPLGDALSGRPPELPRIMNSILPFCAPDSSIIPSFFRWNCTATSVVILTLFYCNRVNLRVVFRKMVLRVC